MATVGVFELVAGATLHTDDVLPFVDVHDTTQAAQGSLKKMLGSVFRTQLFAMTANDTIPTLTVGSGTPAGSAQPLELVGSNCGIALTSTSTAVAGSVESYATAFIPASTGVKFKVGSLAFQWASKDTTTGYGCLNFHTSYFSAPGVQADDIWFTGYAKNGAAFFSGSSAAAQAPGLNILKIWGDLQVTGNIEIVANNHPMMGTTTGAVLTSMVNIDTSDRLELNAISAALRIINPATQSTIGANGAASALTANPLGYLKVSLGAVGNVIIPYYNV